MSTNFFALIAKKKFAPSIPTDLKNKASDEEVGRMVIEAIREIFQLGPEGQILQQVVEANFDLHAFQTKQQKELRDTMQAHEELRSSIPPIPSRPTLEEAGVPVRIRYRAQQEQLDSEIQALTRRLTKLSVNERGKPSDIPAQPPSRSAEAYEPPDSSTGPPAMNTRGARAKITREVLLAKLQGALSPQTPGNHGISISSPAPRLARGVHEAMDTPVDHLGVPSTPAAGHNAEYDVIKDEIRQRKRQLASMKSNMAHAIDQAYQVKLEEYEMERAMIRQYDEQKATIQRKQDEVGAVVALVTHLQQVSSYICSQLRDQLEGYHQVKNQLSGMILLKATNENVANPLAHSHLSGVYAILTLKYYKPTAVDFFQTLQRTLATKMDPNTDLMEGVVQIDQLYDLWEKMDYWSFMTKDLFFTLIGIQSFPSNQSAIRERAMQHILEKMGQMDRSREEAGGGSMMMTGVDGGQPTLYQELKSYVRLLCESKRTVAGTTTTTSSEAGGGGGRSHYGRGHRNQQTAHAAANGATTSKEATKPVSQVLTSAHVFKEQIRANRFHSIVNGKTVPYTATLGKCPQCSDDTKRSHAVPCVMTQCNQCLLYGHIKANCHQHNNAGFRSAFETANKSA